MSRIIQCSECHKRLQVPDELLGKRCKCPSCGVVITAVAAAGEPSPSAAFPPEAGIQQGIDPPKPPPLPPREGDAPPKQDEEDREEPWDEPRRPRRSRRPEDARPLDDDDDSWDVPRHRQIARKPELNPVVLPPAICLLVTGILGILINLFQTVAAIGFPELLDNNMFGQAAPPALNAIFGVVFLIMSVVVAVGASTMMMKKAYTLSFAGTILAMVNVGNCCCVLGLPIGIWALIVLCRPEVKDAFS